MMDNQFILSFNEVEYTLLATNVIILVNLGQSSYNIRTAFR